MDCAAVSSPEACATPALRSSLIDAPWRATGRCPTTLNKSDPSRPAEAATRIPELRPVAPTQSKLPEGQVSGWSGPPPLRGLNTRFRPSPTFMRGIRPTATSLFPPSDRAPRTSALAESGHPVDQPHAMSASTHPSIASNPRHRSLGLDRMCSGTQERRPFAHTQCRPGRLGSVLELRRAPCPVRALAAL